MKEKRFLGGISATSYLFIGIIAALLISFVHYLTYPSLSVSIFYIVPVLLVSYLAGMRAGIALAVISVVLMWFAEWDLLRVSESTIIQMSPETISAFHSIFHLSVFVLTALLLSGYRILNKRFDDKNMLDQLTGLYNRHGFHEIAGQELKQDARYLHPLSVASFDISNFKKVNEDQGEGIGNMLLQTVARTAKKTIRSSDIIARIGSDEFIVLFSESGEDSLTGAKKLQQKLQKILARNNWPVQLSMGHATFLKPPENTEVLIKTAGTLLERARNKQPGSIEHENYGSK